LPRELHNVVIPDSIRNPGFSVKLVLDLIGEREHSSLTQIIRKLCLVRQDIVFSLILGRSDLRATVIFVKRFSEFGKLDEQLAMDYGF
jgi:hypothetical protein